MRPHRYRILVSGRLSKSTSEVGFEDLCVDYEGANTCLTGELDQAALYGVLNRILDFGLELVALSRLDDEPKRRPDVLACLEETRTPTFYLGDGWLHPERGQNRTGRKCLIVRGFRMEPPIGIEPMTYALRACPPTRLVGRCRFLAQAQRVSWAVLLAVDDRPGAPRGHASGLDLQLEKSSACAWRAGSSQVGSSLGLAEIGP